MSEITEDSLFEVLESESRNDEISNVYNAKELAGRYIDYKLNYENDDDIDSTIIEEINKELDEGNYSVVKEGRLEEILDYKLSEPGKVEYENICRKIAKTMQVGDRNTFVFKDEGKVICVSQEDNAPECVTKYDNWKECFDYEFYSQLKDDINDLGLHGVFNKRECKTLCYGGYDFIDDEKPYLSAADLEFLLNDDLELLESCNVFPIDLKNDLEKRRDFCNLPARDFLYSFDYINPDDYFLTELEYPEYAIERDIMLENSMKNVKLDYLFNKYHIHDHQDRAITLADIQNKDFKDIQLMIENPALERDASITIVADDFNDFVKCLESWGYSDFDVEEEIRMGIEEGEVGDSKVAIEVEWNKLREVEEELKNFSFEVTKWKEQSREYAEVKGNEGFNNLDKEAFFSDIQRDKYKGVTTKEWPEGNFINVNGFDYNIDTKKRKDDALRAAYNFINEKQLDKYAEPKRDAVKDSQNLKAASENKNIKNPTK